MTQTLKKRGSTLGGLKRASVAAALACQAATGLAQNDGGAPALASAQAIIDPRGLTVLNNRLLFNAFHKDHGQALWSVDPETLALERLTTRMRPGFRGAAPSWLTVFDGKLYFAADDGVSGMELWRSDGTPGGTSPVKDIAAGESGSTPAALQVLGDALYFVAAAAPMEFRLWKTQGDAASTVAVAGAEQLANPGQLTVVGNRLFFAATHSRYGNELWVIDRAGAMPRLVKDIRPGSEDGKPSELTAVGDAVFFVATDGQHGWELWKSDGSSGGTSMVKDIRPGLMTSQPTYLTAAGRLLFFTANDAASGVELWKSDGTAAGTQMVKDIRPGAPGSGTSFLVELAGGVMFAATDGTHGLELWKSDGTEAGTVMVKDLVAGAGSGLPNQIKRVGNRVMFAAAHAASTSGEQRPWSSDGSAEGTVPMAPQDGALRYLFPSRFTAVGTRTAFVARDGAGNERLWLAEPEGNVRLVGMPLSERVR